MAAELWAADSASQLETTLVGGGLTLAGTLLGTLSHLLLERRRRTAAREQWMLDRQFDNYAQLMDASTAFDLAVRAARNGPVHAARRRLSLIRVTAPPVPMEDVEHKLSSLVSAYHRLSLVTPDSNRVLAHAVATTADALANVIDASDESVFTSAREAYATAMSAFAVDVEARLQVRGAKARFGRRLRSRLVPARIR